MKKKLIIAAIVIAIIVGVMLYMHYTPFRCRRCCRLDGSCGL